MKSRSSTCSDCKDVGGHAKRFAIYNKYFLKKNIKMHSYIYNIHCTYVDQWTGCLRLLTATTDPITTIAMTAAIIAKGTRS
mgnify:CR=1 FL=1